MRVPLLVLACLNPWLYHRLSLAACTGQSSPWGDILSLIIADPCAGEKRPQSSGWPGGVARWGDSPSPSCHTPHLTRAQDTQPGQPGAGDLVEMVSQYIK